MSDYYTIVQNLERELENAQKREARKWRDNAKRAQIAHVLGTTRDLAVNVKQQLAIDHPCPYCGGPLGPDPHADHIYPVAKGGQSRLENMVYVCFDCNAKKRDLTLAAFIVKYGLDRKVIEKRLHVLRKEY